MKRILLLGISSLLAAQNQDDRQIWNSEFLSQRPAAPKSSGPPPKAIYRPATPRRPSAERPSQSHSIVGVTLWRLRPALAADGPALRDLIPERIEASTSLQAGDRIRISIEAARTGYLYVIEREQFNGGRLGAPTLIYPNELTPPGGNAVSPGRVIEIPDRQQRESWFTVESRNADHVGEVLSLLVFPTPIDAPVAKLSELESKGKATVERLDLVNGAGKIWTPQERSAGGDRSLRLTQSDSMPQTLYRVPLNSSQALLVDVPVVIRQ